MKKILLFIFFIILSVGIVSADSDYENDYTIIDCVNGDNTTGVAFEKDKPYATLKEGIENTISYINSNVNIVGNEETASGILFNIKVQCSFNDILNQSINLDYNGVKYNNELLIEGIDDNSFIIKDVNFVLGNKAGNIIFKNVRFLNETKAYFNDYLYTFEEKKIHPFSNGVKIIDSYIILNNNFNIGAYEKYKVFSYRGGNRYTGTRSFYNDFYNDLKNFNIQNSIIEINIDSNYNFKIPTYIKDSKIYFNNKTEGVFDISFSESGNKKGNTDNNFSILTSNEIDLGGNDLFIENTDKIIFLNNNIINFNKLDLDGAGIFINNYFENNETIDISKTHELYNNVFKSAFTDTYDIFNNRKNFSEDNKEDAGIGWVYKRMRDLSFFNVDINSADLYEEITGNKLPNGLTDIYVIFNY